MKITERLLAEGQLDGSDWFRIQEIDFEENVAWVKRTKVPQLYIDRYSGGRGRTDGCVPFSLLEFKLGDNLLIGYVDAEPITITIKFVDAYPIGLVPVVAVRVLDIQELGPKLGGAVTLDPNGRTGFIRLDRSYHFEYIVAGRTL